ncbi:hypothetical protein [uncultured Chryseobacterium sp.]|uniref:hypothetical protein n=1 Tax=uncultured Chryseobacterium sp. TaxID=259322 RepID=UPI0025D50C41|nr:hypothetical protein [uncultured Chryseobacterium sp.]
MKNLYNFLMNFKTLMIFNGIVLTGKIIYSFLTGFNGNTFEDWSIAENLVRYGSYSEFINVGPTAYKLPVYPLFLSAFIFLFQDYAKEAIVIAQHIIYFFIPVLMIRISGMFNIRNVGLLTSYLFLLSPAYLIYSNTLESTNVFIIIFLNFLYQWSRVWLRGLNPARIIGLSASTVLLFLCQVVVVPLSVLLLISLYIFKKANLKPLALVFGLVILGYSPWVIRNYFTFDRLVISKTPVWQNRYFGYYSDVQVFKALQVYSVDHEAEILRMRRNTDEFRMEDFYRREVKKIESAQPLIVVKKALANILMLWYVPSRYYQDHSISIWITRKLYVMILNILTVCSLIFLYRNKSWTLLAFSVLLFLNFTAPYALTHSANTRFKLDFEWFQLFLTAYFLYFTVLKNKHEDKMLC